MGEESRAYIRHPVALPALATFSGQYTLVCSMSDFCIGGFYLQCESFKDGHKPDVVAIHQPLVVEFETPDGGQFLEGEIARIDAQGGIGVRLTQRNLPAILFLQDLSAEQRIRQSENQKQQQLKLDCGTIISAFWNGFFEFSLHKLENHLFEVSNQLSPQERQPYYDAFLLVQKKGGQISNRFLRRIDEQIAVLHDKEAVNGYQIPQGDDFSHSQVEKTAFNNWIAATALISDIENRRGGDLVVLEKRLSMIAVQPIHRENNPAGPFPIVHIIANVLAEFFPDSEVAHRVFKVFAVILQRRLGELYVELNTFFKKNHILENYATHYELQQPAVPNAQGGSSPLFDGSRSEWHGNSNRFESASTAFGAGYSPAIAAEIAQVVKDVKSRQLKRYLTEKLERVICGQPVPLLLLELLELGWKNLLIGTLIREGMGSPTFVTYLQVVEQLKLFLNYPYALSPEQFQRATKLLEWLERMLPVAATDTAKIAHFMERLKAALVLDSLGRLPLAKRELKTLKTAATEPPPLPERPEGYDPALWQKLVQRALNLKRGVGIIVRVNGQPTRYGLIWHDSYERRLLFLDATQSRLIHLTVCDLVLKIAAKEYLWG